MEFEDDQRVARRIGSRQARRVAALLYSVNPEGFQAAEDAKRVCDQAWGCRADEPTTKNVAKGFDAYLAATQFILILRLLAYGHLFLDMVYYTKS